VLLCECEIPAGVAAPPLRDRFPDPAVWLRRPTPARLMDLHRFKPWPLSWCFIQRHWSRMLEFCWPHRRGEGCRSSGPEHEPENLAAGREGPPRFAGLGSKLAAQVGLLAASTICLAVGKRVRQLNEEEFATC